MEPFFLKADRRHYLWGGRRLITQMNKPDEGATLAESWELACHPKAATSIADGPLAGMRFGDFARQYPQYIGCNTPSEKDFPVLVKLLDTQQCNSIQVHPSDEYALPREMERGKTEMWLVLDAAPNAFIYAGFSRVVTKDEVRRRVEDGTLEEVLQQHPAKAGDFFFIPPGTVHAIGAGILLAEIQQNSDLTYRLYDFNRVGPDGILRALHMEKALEVATLAPVSLKAPGTQTLKGRSGGFHRRMAKTCGFNVDTLTLEGSYEMFVETDSFLYILCTAGQPGLQCGKWQRPLRAGDSVFVPAGTGTVLFMGYGEMILVTLAD